MQNWNNGPEYRIWNDFSYQVLESEVASTEHWESESSVNTNVRSSMNLQIMRNGKTHFWVFLNAQTKTFCRPKTNWRKFSFSIHLILRRAKRVCDKNTIKENIHYNNTTFGSCVIVRTPNALFHRREAYFNVCSTA